jgi:small subunit ribosomal protein S4e
MPKKHLKRLVAPRTWNILRKTTKYVARPLPGKHSFYYSMSLSEIIKLLGFAATKREIVDLLKTNELFVDGKKTRELKYNVGLMDTFSIPAQKLFYRVSLSEKGQLAFIPIPEKEVNLKVCRIEQKRLIKGKKIQLSLHDGRNIPAKDDSYKVGDSVVIDLTNNEIKEHVKFAPKTTMLLIGGSKMGKIGVLKTIEPNKLTYELDKEEHSTIKKNVFCIGSIKVK